MRADGIPAPVPQANSVPAWHLAGRGDSAPLIGEIFAKLSNLTRILK